MTIAYLRGLARDEGRRPAESAGAPAAVPVPPTPDEAQDAPMDDGAGVRAPTGVIETSRKRSAEDAGHETDDADGAIQDRWLRTAYRRPCGMQGRSVLMLWHWQKRSRQQGSSDELVSFV